MAKNAKQKSSQKTDNQRVQLNGKTFELQNFTRMPFFRKAATNKIKNNIFRSFILFISPLVVGKINFINFKFDHQDKEVEKIFDFILLELVEKSHQVKVEIIIAVDIFFEFDQPIRDHFRKAVI